MLLVHSIRTSWSKTMQNNRIVLSVLMLLIWLTLIWYLIWRCQRDNKDTEKSLTPSLSWMLHCICCGIFRGVVMFYHCVTTWRPLWSYTSSSLSRRWWVRKKHHCKTNEVSRHPVCFSTTCKHSAAECQFDAAGQPAKAPDSLDLQRGQQAKRPLTLTSLKSELRQLRHTTRWCWA